MLKRNYFNAKKDINGRGTVQETCRSHDHPACTWVAPKQSNEIAAYTLLALLDLKPIMNWTEASDPLRGITPIIQFIKEHYDVHYAPNTRETVRDESVKYFAESGLLRRNPDNPNRPTNSVKTVYQIEQTALELKDLFAGCKAGLVFVTAFESRESMRSFLALISWETEVWVATDRDHLIHFNGERFLGPYPDVAHG